LRPSNEEVDVHEGLGLRRVKGASGLRGDGNGKENSAGKEFGKHFEKCGFRESECYVV
jgi:hypothetical protein